MKYILLLKKTLLAALLTTGIQSFGQLTPYTVGTIAPGDSIVIYYDVTINNPCGCTQISNQGTVSGSNFSTFNTDDPDTAPLGDPTITPLNMFPLPVSVYELRAQAKNNGVEVRWNVASETNMLKYEIERSTDGMSFTKIGENPAANRYSQTAYTFFDATPNRNVNYYRLRLVEQSSNTKYSTIVKVDLGSSVSEIKFFPNPLVQNSVTVQLTNLQQGHYELLFYNSIGQLAFRKNLVHDGGSANKSISLPNGLTKGIYSVQLKTGERVYKEMLMLQ